MGFSLSDIDILLLDDDDVDFAQVPVVDQHENHHHPCVVPVSNSTVQPASVSSPFNALATVGLLPSLLSKQPQLSSLERWVARRVDEKRGLKRDLQDQAVHLQAPKKKLDSISARATGDDANISSTQPSTMLRERQRRDDMTSKFAVLESLLPVRLKRDRLAIVCDSIKHVTNLRQCIKSLRDRKVEWKPRLNDQSAVSQHNAVLRSCLEEMKVLADLPHQVVLEMVCKPEPGLHSIILLCMEHLNLDVMQCSITRTAGRLVCVITAKPREENTSGIGAAFKRAVQR